MDSTQNIVEIVNKQREYFLTGATLPINSRIDNLKKIRSLLLENEENIKKAFLEDYHKCAFDVIANEFSMVIMEIDYLLKHIKSLAKPHRVKGNLINFPSKGYKYYDPYGVVLVMAPWNYPLQLSMIPLVDAIACGNTVVLKPSNYSKNVSDAMYNMLQAFDEKLITVVLGGRNENQMLLEQKFDYIFFTGGDVVGRLVMEKASKNLTPVSLELGGKSPCIITSSADLDLAAKRITWGKFLNAGQTCVAPDYMLVHESVHALFIEKVKAKINEYYYVNGKISNDFPHIINDKHVERLSKLIDAEKLVCGGQIEGRLIHPTVLDNVTFGDPVMQEEIFGPIMPIIPYTDFDEVINRLKSIDHPLALYIFSSNKDEINKALTNVAFGGGCVNDVIMHLTNDNLPFGGVGRSGMGSYHGKKSFYTFSHEKSVFVKGKMEINVKYPPYNEKKIKTMKKFTNCK